MPRIADIFGYCFGVIRALTDVFREMDRDAAKVTYRDAWTSGERLVGRSLWFYWKVFRSKKWTRDFIIVGCAIALFFASSRATLHMPLGPEIALAFVYSFAAYIPNAMGFLDDDNELAPERLMTGYYWFFLLGVVVGSRFIIEGLTFFVAATMTAFVLVDILAGLTAIKEREEFWKKEAEDEARKTRP